MRRILVICLLFASIQLRAQYESIIRYANGNPEYVMLGDSGMLLKNTCLSPYGDTIYSWDVRNATFIDYPVTGTYLLPAEYESVQKALFLKKHKEGGVRNITMLSPPSPGVKEWKIMHDYFFKQCPVYTMIVRQGPFTVIIHYDREVQTGRFEKYYYNKLVISGNYKNGVRKGLWRFHSYPYYPYEDLELANFYGKNFSLFYAVFPAIILALFIFFIARSTIKSGSYVSFFYTMIFLALVMLLLRLNIQFDRVNIWVRETVPAIWFVFWHAMTAMAAINLFFSKKIKTPIMLNMLCLLVGLSFSLFILFFKHLDF